ncbi:MAG: RNA pseudouridine synthase [Treponema sp.]|jgi:RluA family pseudouridine synthase|nr:RNA pseudouridine synthase [Treponema sp.]
MKKNSPFTVIYRDARVVAVNKSPGIAVTADRWDPAGERLDQILAAALTEPAQTEQFRLWTVHRIDRDTSGLVFFARDEETHRSLSLAFERRRVEKRYLAVVYGRPLWKETNCDLPLVPDGNKKHQTIIDKYRGKESLTCFRFLGGVGNYSVVEAMPKTGRTHQIRVHLAALGHPVVCDSLYGSGKPVFLSSFKPDRRGDPFTERPLLNRLGLHAAELALPYNPEPGGPARAGQPDGKQTGGGQDDGDQGGNGLFKLKAPLSRDMAALINQMEKRGAGKNLAGLP